jgi:hypothetical protein
MAYGMASTRVMKKRTTDIQSTYGYECVNTSTVFTDVMREVMTNGCMYTPPNHVLQSGHDFAPS